MLMRFTDAFLSFPSIFLLLALAAFIRPGPADDHRHHRGDDLDGGGADLSTEVRSLRERDFILAARMLGLSNRWIMFRELLPNAIGPIIVAATLTVARAILLEAYVSFLGYGIQPPLPSWGNMLNGAQQYLRQRPVAGDRSRHRHHARRHQLQFHRRRPARCARCPQRSQLRRPA